MVDSVTDTVEAVLAHGGEFVQPVGAEALEITAHVRDPASNVVGLYRSRTADDDRGQPLDAAVHRHPRARRRRRGARDRLAVRRVRFHRAFRSPRPGEVSASLLIRVEDVDAHHERARAHGARILQRPTSYPYGQRQYTAEDPSGHRWSFSQTIADVAPEDWGGTSHR